MAGESPEGAPSRVAVVHSFYSSRQPSGENDVVEQQVAALGRAGVRTLLVAQHTDERERSPLYPLQAALTVATGVGPDPLPALRDFRPDIVHVHNLFPNFGRTWVSRWDGPLVVHAHNYRPLCAPGSFYRDGHICTECLDRHSGLPGLRHACYRNSWSQTLPLTLSTRFADDPVLARADRIIALTDEMRALYVRAGVPSSRIDVVANFIPSSEVPNVGPGGEHWVYAGRLAPEKGILELVQGWPPGRRLVVVGSGPLEHAVRDVAGKDVEVLGRVPRQQLRTLVGQAVGLLFPSRWLEGLGLVALEALAAGTPVMAWRPAPAASLVEQLGVGLVGHPDLETSLSEAEAQFPLLRQRCREVFESHFSEDVWHRRTRAVYALARQRRTGGQR